MIGLLYLFLALLCQNPKQQTHGHCSSSTQVSAYGENGDDDNGDSGHVPPTPPPPPIKP